MEKCIYTKKTGKETSFTSEEHVIPKCIGGIKKLKKGFVSDEFNNAISKAEEQFSREYPMVVLPRMMYGPKGRKSHSGKSNLSFLKSMEDNFIQLGYIENGKPCPALQLIVGINPKNEEAAIEFVQGVITQKGEEKELLEALLQYKDDFECIRSDDPLMKNRICIGIAQKKIYLGFHEKMSKGDAREYMEMILRLAMENRLKVPTDLSMELKKHKVEYKKKLAFIIDSIQRVYAKMAFNTLALIKGQEFVLREEFDPLREAIATGTNIQKYVSLPETTCSVQVAKLLRFKHKEHFIFLKKERKALYGIVILYGGSSSVMVKLAGNWKEGFESCGFICDWMDKEEFLLDEFILRCYLDLAGTSEGMRNIGMME